VLVTTDQAHDETLHPMHAFFVAATVPLFLGAALSDWAYTSTYHVQWSNFSSWLIVDARRTRGRSAHRRANRDAR
jgi:hypothetical protein